MRILYDSKKTEFKSPFGTIKTGEECKINIHIPKHCRTKEVSLEIFKESGGNYAAASLVKGSEYTEYEIYSGSFSINDAGLYFYRFYIITEEGDFPLFKQGYDMTNMCEGEMWQLSCIDKGFTTPKSFFGSTMYQIFPDRFYKSGEVNLKGKLEPYTIHEKTNEIPSFRPDINGEVLNNDFYGGNLNGIAKKLPYLKKLGVSVIYLNPIFKAFSNHRYDTADYKKIDEMLGSEQDFKNLCKKAHRLNIKIILDGVFSHTGSNSVYFDKNGIFGNGAYHNESSPYKEWFDFKAYPDGYTSWWGIETLPCVKEMNESYLNYIIEGEDSVVEHWLKLGADGFRLDVADELPDEFIERLRKRLKGINENALLIGEVWEDASNKCSYGVRRKYFLGKELDSVMNYPFRTAIIDYVLSRDNGESFRNTVMTICENYPPEVTLSLMNMLSTHDTQRLVTVLSGVEAPKTKEERAEFKLSESELEKARHRVYAASFLQFVLPGMPCIYYGDEILTQGFEDPFCRTFFDWEKVENEESVRFFSALSSLRERYKALKFGSTRVEHLGDGFVKIIREYKGKKLEAFVNCSQNEMQIEGKSKFKLNAIEQNGKIKIMQNGFVLI